MHAEYFPKETSNAVASKSFNFTNVRHSSDNLINKTISKQIYDRELPIYSFVRIMVNTTIYFNGLNASRLTNNIGGLITETCDAQR